MATKIPLPRIEYKKILYVTDLSEAGRNAFPYAASLANRYAAQLTVFHVVEPRNFEKYLVGYIDEDLWNEIKTRDLQDARQLLIDRKRDDATIRDNVDQFCQETLSERPEQPYVTYDVVVETGEPVEKIVQAAQNGGFDLVVMGKQGHGVVRGAFVGDTATRVVRRCLVPVMVVPVDGHGRP
jgi:nucleotide-binding universal stress UspA family protein